MCCMDVGFSRSTQIVFHRLVLTCLNIGELRAAYIDEGTTFETQCEVATVYQNILIPVLVDEEYHNQASFDVAKKLAGKDAKFTILHAMEPIPGFALAEIPEDVLNKTRNRIETSVSEMAQDFVGSEAKIISGHAGRAIVDDASTHEIDCIIVASHRPGIGDFFLGSTAARDVRHATCSVHVIR